jgi:hypothetical protein
VVAVVAVHVKQVAAVRRAQVAAVLVEELKQEELELQILEAPAVAAVLTLLLDMLVETVEVE